ncbi:MAG: c-type cytochrome [Chloroflexi bacterium]|nr:c-type cytochrome [Chloroflexota bacterium]
MNPTVKRLVLPGLAAATLLMSACIPTPPPPPAKTEGAAKPAAAASKPGGGGGAGDTDAGKTLFTAKGCIACHVAPGVPGAVGTIGPSLAGIGDAAKRPKLASGEDNTAPNIRGWIKDPQAKKPGTMMPALGLSDKESDDLTAFLITLK